MAKFLNKEGLDRFLYNLKQIFVKDISEGSTSGAFQYKTYEEVTDKETGAETLQEKTVSVQVHNVVTTDTEQTISGAKTFTGTVKVPDIADSATDTGLAANKKYVDDKIAANDAMAYKGTLNQSSDLPVKSDTTNKIKVGATYKVATAGTYAGQAAKVGDLFIAQAINSSKDITWDYIPAGDETETSVRVSDGTTSVTVGTTSKVGPDITFGQAAAKQVDTSISAGSTSTNVPTSAAVANYALKEVKNATNDSSLTIGTKASGEQTLAVKVKANSGITSDSNGLSANVNANSGLSINSSTGAIELTTPGNGIEVDSTTHTIQAVGNTTKGIEVSGSGIGIALTADASGLTFNNGTLQIDAGSGITFDESTGALKVAIGSGTTSYLLFDDSEGLAVDIQSLTGDGLTIDVNNKLAVNVEQLAGDGLAINGSTIDVNIGSGLTFDEDDGKLIVNISKGLTFDDNGNGTIEIKAGSGLAVGSNPGDSIFININDFNGLGFNDNKELIINAGSGITFDEDDGKLIVKVKPTNSGLNLNGSGVSLKLDSNNANGLSVGANGLALATATPSTSGVGGSAGAMSAADKEKLDNLDSAYAKNLDVAAGANNTVDLQLKDGQGTAAVLDTVNISSTNKAIGVGVGTASGSTTKLEITANVNTAKGLKIDNTSGIEINNGNGLTFASGESPNALTVQAKTDGGITVDATGVSVNSGNGLAMEGTSGSQTLNVKAYDGITVDSNGVSADIDTTAGLKFTGDTAGSKKIGIALEATDSGLAFDNTTGGLYVDPITNDEIDRMFIA